MLLANTGREFSGSLYTASWSSAAAIGWCDADAASIKHCALLISLCQWLQCFSDLTQPSKVFYLSHSLCSVYRVPTPAARHGPAPFNPFPHWIAFTFLFRLTWAGSRAHPSLFFLTFRLVFTNSVSNRNTYIHTHAHYAVKENKARDMTSLTIITSYCMTDKKVVIWRIFGYVSQLES